MENKKISEKIFYIGANDKDLDIFEGQYKIPNGISYNSYIIKDEKIAIMDTIDKRKTTEWLENIENVLNGDIPNYLVISHLEPDHAYNIEMISKKYPNMKLVGNQKTFEMLPQFFNIENLEERKIVVKEGDTLSLGEHCLQFFMAPMVHWPEVMVEYEQKEKILFSADGFGKFGSLDVDEPWEEEARRYYFNIVGKYGMPVQALLKKASTLDIKTICPLHGPILRENLEYYIKKYDMWSRYQSDDEETVLILCGSIHGNTLNCCKQLQQILKNEGKESILLDITRTDTDVLLSNAFKYKKVIFASSSYNAGLFSPMENLLNWLKAKNYQNKKIGLIENGSWAPSAAKVMKEIIAQMKNIEIIEPVVTIKSTLNEESKKALNELAKNMNSNS